MASEVVWDPGLNARIPTDPFFRDFLLMITDSRAGRDPVISSSRSLPIPSSVTAKRWLSGRAAIQHRHGARPGWIRPPLVHMELLLSAFV